MVTEADKRLAFETLYDSGKVRVVFDMLHEGVSVPERAKTKSKDGRLLAFDYSKRFAMPHFKVDDKGISASLTFGGPALFTFVPWRAVVGLAQEGKVMESWGLPEHKCEIEFTIAESDVKWLCQTVAEG